MQYLDSAAFNKNRHPRSLVAKTKKGAGISFLEDKEGWHGKALGPEQLETALAELNPLDINLVGIVEKI